MSVKPQFEFKSIRDQRIFKIAAVTSMVLAIVLASVAVTLHLNAAIDNFMFNILMGMAALLLMESLILPKILRQVKGRKYEFYDDHMKYYITKDRNFTVPYSMMRGVRSEPIKETHRYKNTPVSDVFIILDKDKKSGFDNTVIRKGELILPAVPDSEYPVRRIAGLITVPGENSEL